MYSSFAHLYILVLFCFGLSACLLFFALFFVFVFVLSFIFFIYLECSTPFHGKIRAVHTYVECLI